MSAANTRIDRRAFLALGGGSAIALFTPRLAFGSPALRTLSGEAFATGWSLAVPDTVDVETLRAPIERLLADIDLQMSPWRLDSDVSRFNRAPAGSLRMPAELVDVTSAALALAGSSGGEFDPTVGPLVARWGFGPIKGDTTPDWRGIGLHGDALSKQHDGLTLDLCGIAKGYALDKMADIVKAAGHADFVIDLGGELSACGGHPSGRSWHAAVEDPRPGVDGVIEVIALGGMAVATSGSRANSYEVGTRRYSHIIDPLTLEPVEGNLLSVSVIASSAMTADGWATALFAAGAANGPELARRNSVNALFVFSDPQGLRRIKTGSFDDYLA
jgi:thiamine biosynthesis lipoprotein